MHHFSIQSSASRLWFLLVAIALSAAGCSTFVKPTLPGETDYAVSDVKIVSPAQARGEDASVALSHGKLLTLLSVRKAAFPIAGQPYNPYRVAEDRRRIVSYWAHQGYMDAKVLDTKLDFDEAEHTVAVTYILDEGQRYTVAKIDIKDAGERGVGDVSAYGEELEGDVNFEVGDIVNLTKQRWVRHAMEDRLRRAGYLHTEVYSRTYVDRDAKTVDQVYFIDAGPPTVIGSVKVTGNVDIPAETILWRAGLKSGEPISFDVVEKREFDLMDAGAFTSARVHTTAQTEFVVNTAPPDGWIPPDSGGFIKPAQIDAAGNLLPRALPAVVDLTIGVVEAPDVQGSVGAGATIDLERFNPFATAETQFRNAFGPLHHLTARARIGYGLTWRTDNASPEGLYGSALLRYTKPGFIGRLLDLRVTARFDEELYPGYNWRSTSGGIGFRSHLGDKLFLDVEPLFRVDWPVGIGTIDPAQAAALGLSTAESTMNGELRLSLIKDARDSGLEALDGWFVGVYGVYAPPLGDSHYFTGKLDLRYMIPLGRDAAVAVKAVGAWAANIGDTTLPIGARLFGGGSYGNRGFGYMRLSSLATSCEGNGKCRALPVGSRSLFDSSLELRWLPWRQQVGAILFADVSAAGDAFNPFEHGLNLALGGGLRARLWHFALSLDMGVRVGGPSRYDDYGRFQAFVRVGESF